MKKIDLRDIRTIIVETFRDADVPESIIGLEIGSLDGWDSLGNFNLLLAIEQEYGFQFDLEEMASVRSVQDIMNSLKAKC